MKKTIRFLTAAVLLHGIVFGSADRCVSIICRDKISAHAVSAETTAENKPVISAKSAVLISADTGEIVFGQNENEKLPMASTTKIMTTLLCLESGDLYEPFVVDSEAIKVEGSSMGLTEGDIVTKYALCCGMLLPSGNDAANAVAVRLAGSIEAFAELMNERARQLGLSRTYFVTPSGLEGEGHGSSAYDMAILAREALRNETFREICSQKSIQTEFGSPPYKRWLKNTNKLLSMCEGVYGVKTGFTDEAGRCLVSACKQGGKSLICVTLNDRNDWNDHISLYDYGFKAVSCVTAEIPGLPDVNTAGSDIEKLRLEPECSSFEFTSLAVSPDDLEYDVVAPPFVYAPINRGDEAAKLRVSYNGREIISLPLYASEDVSYVRENGSKSRGNENIFKKIKRKLGRIFS